jgi:hypothetical protein
MKPLSPGLRKMFSRNGFAAGCEAGLRPAVGVYLELKGLALGSASGLRAKPVRGAKPSTDFNVNGGA